MITLKLIRSNKKISHIRGNGENETKNLSFKKHFYQK